MDSKKLEILITAVDLGSFSKASEVVGYTQSGLTHLADSLEREIGFPLINRSRNGITLTPEGQKLLPAIRDFLRANAGLENQIKALAENQTETIRIAAYASIALHWMPDILYRFRRICPKVDVDLRMVDHALEPFELLESGRTDVIFGSRQPAFHCDWIPLYEEEMVAILPKDYPVKSKTEFPIEEFDGKDFIMPYGRFDRDVLPAMKKKNVRIIEQSSRVDDETVVRMVGRGLGISMMGRLMIRGNTEDVQIIPVIPHTVRELGMGLPSGVPVTGNIQALKDCVLEYAKDLQ